MQKIDNSSLLFPAEQIEWEKRRKKIFVFTGPLYKQGMDELKFHELKFQSQLEFMEAFKKWELNRSQLEEARKKWRPINDIAIKEAALVGQHFLKFKKKEHKELHKNKYRHKFNSVIRSAAEAGKIQMKDPNYNLKWTLEKQIDVIVDAVRLRYLSSLKQQPQQAQQQQQWQQTLQPVLFTKVSPGTNQPGVVFTTSTGPTVAAK